MTGLFLSPTFGITSSLTFGSNQEPSPAPTNLQAFSSFGFLVALTLSSTFTNIPNNGTIQSTISSPITS